MKKPLLSTLAMLLIAVSALAQPPKQPKLTWFGQSFFVVETTSGTRIAFDPHGIDAFGRPTTKADLVLISHPHGDHTRLEQIENRAKAKVIEGIKVGPGGPAKGEWNAVDEKFREVRIRSVPTYHDKNQGLQRGKNTIFVIEFDGLKLAHLGDLGHTLSDEQLRMLGPIDVLLIPIGGVYTLNGDSAKKVVAQIKPTKYIVPMHYGTPLYSDLQTADEFLDGQTNVKLMTTTNIMELDVTFKPATPQIVMLGSRKE